MTLSELLACTRKVKEITIQVKFFYSNYNSRRKRKKQNDKLSQEYFSYNE